MYLTNYKTPLCPNGHKIHKKISPCRNIIAYWCPNCSKQYIGSRISRKNPILKVSKELIGYLERISADRKAGHEALDYWEGAAAGALIAGNTNPRYGYTKDQLKSFGFDVPSPSKNSIRWYYELHDNTSGSVKAKGVQEAVDKVCDKNLATVDDIKELYPDNAKNPAWGSSDELKKHYGKYRIECYYGDYTTYRDNVPKKFKCPKCGSGSFEYQMMI
jgi:predicted RNA-binding Zn-ribbon protein involved in translation (DUF1610 family)